MLQIYIFIFNQRKCFCGFFLTKMHFDGFVHLFDG